MTTKSDDLRAQQSLSGATTVPRFGAYTVTHTGTHYDGGFSSAGVFAYGGATAVWVEAGNPVNEPNFAVTLTWRQASWIDHAAWLSPITTAFVVYPPVPDKELEMHMNLLDSSIEDSNTVRGGSAADGCYALNDAIQGSFLTKGSRFARNTAVTAAGEGGIKSFSPPSGSLMPTMKFEDNAWLANVAGSGPAVFVTFGQVDVQFKRCLFRYLP